MREGTVHADRALVLSGMSAADRVGDVALEAHVLSGEVDEASWMEGAGA